MKVPEPEEEQPLAWTAILEYTPVLSSEGTEVGTVEEVLGAEDIFHGIVLRSGDSGRLQLIPADAVRTITNRKIETTLTSNQVRDMSAYEPERSFGLGIVGIFRKRLGWVPDDGRSEPD
jgi:hypothetical protein